jgi:hypothetical protein
MGTESISVELGTLDLAIVEVTLDDIQRGVT